MAQQSVARLTKSVKRIEKPRPLKIGGAHVRNSVVSSAEELMSLVESVSMNILNGNCDKAIQSNITAICGNLKSCGQQLEEVYKDQLDRAFIIFRNGCRDDRLDKISRTHLLEIIELRANNWSTSDNLANYYKPKFSSMETETLATDLANHPGNNLPFVGTSAPIQTTPVQTLLLTPGEVIKTSGKFAKPTKIPGKNYCKDEVVIRNSDSGKVNPGAKERLVQITGPDEDKINYAKQLMEDTIRRNASPVRIEQTDKERVGGSSSSLNSSASDESSRLTQSLNRKLLHSFSTNDATLGEYKYTVTVGNHSIKITGTNLDLVRTAKLVLDEFFSGEPDQYTADGDYFNSFEGCPSAEAVSTRASFPMGSRVESMDSGATSDSEETYKASAASETASRQAIVSGLLSDEYEVTEETRQGMDDELNEGAHHPISREDLLQLALSPFSTDPPEDWDAIAKEYPMIAKKAAEPFDPVEYAGRWQDVELHSVICSTKVDLAEQE